MIFPRLNLTLYEDVLFLLERRKVYPSVIEEAVKELKENLITHRMVLEFSKCLEGEVINGKLCELCPPGTYSKLTVNATRKRECVSCPKSRAVCLSGRIWPERGYWRDHDGHEDHFVPCPRMEACS